MKRTSLAALLSAVVLVGTTSGCGSQTPPATSSPASSSASSAQTPVGEQGASSSAAALEPVTFTMLYRDSPAYPFDPNWPALQAIQKEQNVTLDIKTVPSKDYASKARILLSSGDIPDIVTCIEKEIAAEYASSGVLLRVSDYMDKLPHLAEKIEQYGISDEVDNWRTKDDGLYILPFMNEAPMYNTAPAFRMDVLEDCGLQVPTNYEELYQTLKTIKEKYPDSYPMANYNGAKNIREICGTTWGIEGSYNGFIFDEATQAFTYANISDNYKEYTQFINKLIGEKLADPEIYTGTLDQWKQKTVSGSSVFCFTWISELGQINKDGKATHGERFQMTAVPPLEGPGGKKSASMGRIYHGTVLPAAVAEKPYFDRLLAFMDWMSYSDEGIVYTTWGIEGETYSEENGKRVFTDKVLNSGSIQKSLWDIGASNNCFTLSFPYDWFIQVLDSPEVDTMTQQAKKENWFPAIAKTPKLDFAQREQEKMLLATLNDYVSQMHEQFVYGKMDIDANWDSYVAEVHAKGLDKLLELYNTK